MNQILTGYEKVATSYTLYRYEQRLEDPLWIHIEGTHNPSVVVRNTARRRVREGIRAALVEMGYTIDGKVAGPKERETGAARGSPKRDLKGTIEIFVQQPVEVAAKSKDRHLAFGKQVIEHMEQVQSAPPTQPRRKKL